MFSTGAIWAGWLFTKEAFKNEKAALWAALLLAINPFQLQYVTEARMYTFGAFFALLTGYFLVRALRVQKELFEAKKGNMPNTTESRDLKRSMVLNYVGFTLGMVVIIYTHYYLFFTAAALAFYGLLYLFFHHEGNWKKYYPLLLSFLIIVLSFLPWFKTFLFQYKQVGQSYWIPPMDKWSIPSTFWDMLLGFARDTTSHTTQIWLIIITLFSLWMLYRFLKRTQSFHKWLVVLAVIAPFCGALLFALLAHLKGSSSSVYLDRYFLFASVYFSVAVAVWLKEVPVKWLSTSLFLIYCLLNLTAFWHYWQQLDVKTKPGMSGAAAYLKANVTSSDRLYVGSSFMFFNFKYYWTVKNASPTANYDTDTGYSFISGNRPLLFTGGVSQAKDISHYAGSALLSDSDLLPSFSVAHPGDTIWLIWTNGFGASKPQVPLNWAQINEMQYPEVRPYVGTNVYVDEYKVN